MRPSDTTFTAPPEETAAPHLSAADEAFLAEMLQPQDAEEQEDEPERLLGLRYDAEGGNRAP